MSELLHNFLEAAKDTAKKGIDMVLSGEINSVDLYFINANIAIEYIQERTNLDYMVDSNEFDFWFNFVNTEYRTILYVLAGDPIFTDSLTFRKENVEIAEDECIAQSKKLATYPLMQLYNQGINEGQALFVNKLNRL